MRIFPFDAAGKQQPFEPKFPCVLGRIRKQKQGTQIIDRTMWTAIRIVAAECNRPWATAINNQAELDQALKAAAEKGDVTNVFVEPADK